MSILLARDLCKNYSPGSKQTSVSDNVGAVKEVLDMLIAVYESEKEQEIVHEGIPWELNGRNE